MDEDQLNDLKQFIANTVSRTEVRLTERVDKLEKKVDAGFAGIGGVIEHSTSGLMIETKK